LSSSTIHRSTAYAKGATQPESVTRSVSKMLSATISRNWHSDCSWSLDVDCPKGAGVPFPERSEIRRERNHNQKSDRADAAWG
jgi:hypothetical protein